MKFLFVSFLLLVFFSCSKEEVQPHINATIKGTELPEQESWNATVFFTDSGKTRAILYAGNLQVFSQSKETLLDDGIEVKFYNDHEVNTTTLTAKKGRVDENTNDLFAIDSVVTVNDSGIVIRTDEMMWRNKDQKIISDKFVTIETDKEKIEGYGFESDQHLRNYVIYNITYVTRTDTL
jgi:LPS export ABC transporter protein LptC